MFFFNVAIAVIQYRSRIYVTDFAEYPPDKVNYVCSAKYAKNF